MFERYKFAIWRSNEIYFAWHRCATHGAMACLIAIWELSLSIITQCVCVYVRFCVCCICKLCKFKWLRSRASRKSAWEQFNVMQHVRYEENTITDARTAEQQCHVITIGNNDWGHMQGFLFCVYVCVRQVRRYRIEYLYYDLNILVLRELKRQAGGAPVRLVACVEMRPQH